MGSTNNQAEAQWAAEHGGVAYAGVKDVEHRVSEIDQRLEVLDTKLDNFSSVPKTHTVKGKNQLS